MKIKSYNISGDYMKDKSIEKKIIGTTWTEVMINLNRVTQKIDSKDDKDTSESGSSSDKT